MAGVMAAPAAAAASVFVPGKVVVGYSRAPSATLQHTVDMRAGAVATAAAEPGVEVLRVARSESVQAAAARLRSMPGVAYAVPDYIAHASGGFVPDDRGHGAGARDWEMLQWNFLPGAGVDAPDAWANLMRDRAPGGRGVVVAILDTGVAYRNWTNRRNHEVFRESPDFVGTRFVRPCDLIQGTIRGLHRGHIAASSTCTDPYALDREGHGTFVAGVVAEATNNHLGVTGLAYGASIMPVRILDAEGNGDSITIARGIRYAATHGAHVINLSLEFDPSIVASDIPDVINAIRYAHSRGVTVVAAAGNDSLPGMPAPVSYPARDSQVISVGATTYDRCRANYSNVGTALDLVAPGGGEDANMPSDPDCHPGRYLPDIFQMTFPNPNRPTRFGLPGGWYGTSMAAPHVAATAALIIASGILGARPSPARVLARMQATAQPLGSTQPNPDYGYGLLDAGAATAGVSLTAGTHTPRTHRHR